jgi:hypothetical protein
MRDGRHGTAVLCESSVRSVRMWYGDLYPQAFKYPSGSSEEKASAAGGICQ